MTRRVSESSLLTENSMEVLLASVRTGMLQGRFAGLLPVGSGQPEAAKQPTRERRAGGPGAYQCKGQPSRKRPIGSREGVDQLVLHARCSVSTRCPDDAQHID